jgi:hypothetical protein
MQPGDLIDLQGFGAFTCLWFGGDFRAGPGWAVTLYPDTQACEGGVLVKLEQGGKLMATRERRYLVSADAVQILRVCRQSGLQRCGYSIGPDLDHLRPDVHHPEALATASQAIAEAWPRQAEGLPVSPAEMLRSIRRLAHVIDALLVQAEARTAGSWDEPSFK